MPDSPAPRQHQQDAGGNMISKDESIVAQVCAKIASELTGMTQTDGSAEAIQATYLNHFDFVREAVGSIHQFPSTAQAVEQELITQFNAKPVQSTGGMTSTSTGITIKGAAHGPVPSWLIDQAAKAGVTSVYDNRDTANAENRRPFFKAADGTTNSKGQPVAFWPPK
jgi:hypothetical protein